MAQRDLGYYVWHLLKAEEETTLFPEFFSIFKAFSRYELIRSLPLHPALSIALQTVADNYGAEVNELEAAVNDVFDILAAHETDDRFKLFWEFIYYFGDTHIEIPHKDKFTEIIQKASVYHDVVSAGNTEEALAKTADIHGLTSREAQKVVDYVKDVVTKFEKLGVPV